MLSKLISSAIKNKKEKNGVDMKDRSETIPSDTQRILTRIRNEFFPESYFKKLLVRERKRSERTKQPFLLMLLDVGEFMEKGTKKEFSSFHSMLYDSSREIDIKGWFESDRIAGIIFTDITDDKRWMLINRMKERIKESLSENHLNMIKIKTYYFPEQEMEYESDESSLDTSVLYADIKEDYNSNRLSYRIKRIGDLSITVSGVIILSPLFLIIAALIKLTSKGPVFYMQERVGFRGKRFSIFKFRTMHENNDTSTHKKFVTDMIKGRDVAQQKEGQKVYKLTDDPRVTKIGSFLRKTSLDELPQLINVITGDMALVGPRPPIPYEFEEYALWHRRRIMEITPGITGIWQVYGRSLTTFDGMVRMDIQYMKKWTPWLDFKLILMTPISMVFSRGGY